MNHADFHVSLRLWHAPLRNQASVWLQLDAIYEFPFPVYCLKKGIVGWCWYSLDIWHSLTYNMAFLRLLIYKQTLHLHRDVNCQFVAIWVYTVSMVHFLAFSSMESMFPCQKYLKCFEFLLEFYLYFLLFFVFIRCFLFIWAQNLIYAGMFTNHVMLHVCNGIKFLAKVAIYDIYVAYFLALCWIFKRTFWK